MRLLRPALPLDVLSVALGWRLTDNVGLALGTKLLEAGYPALYAGGEKWWQPGPWSALPLYVYGVVGNGGESSWSRPTLEAFVGVGAAFVQSEPMPFFRLGVRAEWTAFGVLRPSVMAEWADVGPQLGVTLALGGWHWSE